MGNTHFKGPVISQNGFKITQSGQAITYVKSGTIDVNPASINGSESGETEVTISGAAVGDIVIMNVPATLETGLAYSGVRVSATDKVQVRLTNVTTDPVNGASLTWTYTIIRVA